MLLTIALIEVRASQICSVSNLATLFKKNPTTLLTNTYCWTWNHVSWSINSGIFLHKTTINLKGTFSYSNFSLAWTRNSRKPTFQKLCHCYVRVDLPDRFILFHVFNPLLNGLNMRIISLNECITMTVYYYFYFLYLAFCWFGIHRKLAYFFKVWIPISVQQFQNKKVQLKITLIKKISDLLSIPFFLICTHNEHDEMVI